MTTASLPLLALLATSRLGCAARDPEAAPVELPEAYEGMALAAKGGALLMLDDGRGLYVAGLSSWPDGLEDHRVKVTGRLVSEHYLPEGGQLENGEWAQGVAPGSGPELVLRDAAWELVE